MNKRIYKEIVNIVADSSGQLYKVYKDGSYEKATCYKAAKKEKRLRKKKDRENA